MGDCKKAPDVKGSVDRLMSTPPLSAYRPFWACHDQRKAGSGVLVKKEIPVISVRRSVTAPGGQHEEGRVLLLEFANVCVLNKGRTCLTRAGPRSRSRSG
jgi:exonuclease III